MKKDRLEQPILFLNSMERHFEGDENLAALNGIQKAKDSIQNNNIMELKQLNFELNSLKNDYGSAFQSILSFMDEYIEQQEEKFLAIELANLYFLDTEHSQQSKEFYLTKIAKYNQNHAEIRQYLIEILIPILFSNLQTTTGVWDSFDMDWLWEQIKKQKYKRKKRAQFINRFLDLWNTRRLKQIIDDV